MKLAWALTQTMAVIVITTADQSSAGCRKAFARLVERMPFASKLQPEARLETSVRL
jgi:hypothetical protein